MMLRPATIAFLLLLTGVSAQAGNLPPHTWKTGGYVGVVLRDYPKFPSENREGDTLALHLAPEWILRQGPYRFILSPDVRLENAGSGRSRADFNELNLSARYGKTIVEFGVTRLFWGVTESRHLENIINPPDLAADFSGETTLGIALLRILQPINLGQIEAILIPWDRDPRYPGQHARLRTALPILGNVRYPDGRPTAWAIRVATARGIFDTHLYYFSGLDREAVLTPQFDTTAQPISLQASRWPIRQWGLDVQAPIGSLLLKGEAIQRSGYSRSFIAVVLGGEYTFNSVADSARDLSLMLEYQEDDRPDDAPLTAMKSAYYGGIRLALNDPNSSELTIGLSYNPKSQAQLWSGDFSRRIAENVTLEGNLTIFSHVDGDPALSGFARDSRIEMQIKRHFH